jgi:hypothetical protein
MTQKSLMITKFPNKISSENFTVIFSFLIPSYPVICHCVRIHISTTWSPWSSEYRDIFVSSVNMFIPSPLTPLTVYIVSKPKHITEITCNRDIDHMCTRHHTHCSVKSVMERGAADPHCLQCVEEVVELSKLEQHTCLPRASRIGGTVHDGLTHTVEKPPLINI